MKITRVLAVAVATLGLATFSGVASADAAAGKANFADACSECHEMADFEESNAADFTASMKKIVAGQQKHKEKLKTTDAEIADLAAYIFAGK
jgi:cytochrome c553